MWVRDNGPTFFSVATERRSNPAGVMRFHADTKVADAVREDPSIVDRLSALSPVFDRLRRPEDRETLGRHVSLADAAAVAGVALSDLLLAANVQSPAACAKESRDAPEEAVPEWMAEFREVDAVRIDVRPLIALDQEPFTMVMTATESVPAGGRLVLDAPFNPLPLQRVLARKGFATYGRRLKDDLWRIYGFRSGGASDTAPPVRNDLGARVWTAADGVHIDVSNLEAPAPLVAILALVDSSDHDGRIVVHHRRDPLYLYPELTERGWSWSRVEGEPGEVRLVLLRGTEGEAGR